MADQRTTVEYSSKNEKNIPHEATQAPPIGFVLPNVPNPQHIEPSSAPPLYQPPPPYNPTSQPGQSVTYQGGRRTVMTWVPYGAATSRKRAMGIGVSVFVSLLIATVMIVVYVVQSNRMEAEFRERTNWNDNFFRIH